MGGERGDWPSRVLTRGSETRDALVPAWSDEYGRAREMARSCTNGSFF